MILDYSTFEADYYNSMGGKFWGNMGAGVLVVAKTTGRFLVAMRSPDVNEPNTYGVIGGKVDDENTVEMSSEALRELEEETGYSGKIEMKLISVYSVPTFQYNTFLGIVPDEYEPVPHPAHEWENSFFKWVTYDELKKLKPMHFGLKYTLEKGKNIIEGTINKGAPVEDITKAARGRILTKKLGL